MRPLHVIHEHTFSDLKFQQSGIHTCFFKDAGYVFVQTVGNELARGKIYSHPYGSKSFFLPCNALLAGCPQHPKPYGLNKSGFFGQGNEVPG